MFFRKCYIPSSKPLYRQIAFAIGLSLIATGCAANPIRSEIPPSSLDPRGPAAANIAELWWLMFALGLGVFLVVLGLMLSAILRRREAPVTTDGRDGNRWILLGGILMPSIILAIVFAATMRSSAMIANVNSSTSDLTIEIVGRRWWWEVNYPDHGIITANEIHIPVGVPVDLVLKSGDVIHSFWVPQLHGKMDLTPGKTTTLRIQADQAGVYRGECAEFCGLQHARMHFMVVAESQEEFNGWVANQQQPVTQSDDELVTRGQTVFIETGCVYCHTIRGLDAGDTDRSTVDLGPDLTHLASRLTIAAGWLPNNRGNLGGWIIDPQHIKPGSLMPANPMSGEDLQALLAFLETLQ